ncbi:DNA damage-inducible protein DinB [Candidatus Nanopelagicaceae bacterium]
MDAAKLLKHMAWANQEIFSRVAELPDGALDAYAVNPEWTVREIMRHIASSATWYGWRLLDRSSFTQEENNAWQAILDETEIAPMSMTDMPTLLARAAKADAVLLVQAELPEGVVYRDWEGKIITRARSTVISQGVHHATEHRAQLVSALEAKGFTTINLDDYDLWNYADTIGE